MGIPWRCKVPTKDDYKNKAVDVDEQKIPSRVSSKAHIVVFIMGLKTFRYLPKRKKKKKLTPDFAVFKMSDVTIFTADASVLVEPEDAKINAIQEMFHSVSRDK